MNRMILRNINFPILIVLTAIAIAIQTSLFELLAASFFPTRCRSTRRHLWSRFIEAWARRVLTLIVGEAAELHSSSPQGVFLISYMAVYLTVRAADKLFVLPTQLPMVKVTMACAAFWRLSVMLTMVLLSAAHRDVIKEMFVHVVPGAVMAAVFGVWVDRGLEKFYTMTFIFTRTPKIRTSSRSRIWGYKAVAFLGQEEQIREFQDRFKYLYAVLSSAWACSSLEWFSCRSSRATRCAVIPRKTESKRKSRRPSRNDFRSQPQTADRQPSGL